MYGVHHQALHDGIPHNYPEPGNPGHFVPEGWDDLDRGICPCGEIVVWDEATDRWNPDRSMVVLVLTAIEAKQLEIYALSFNKDLHDVIDRELSLNQPLTEEEMA